MNGDWLADTHHLTRHAQANSEVGDEEVLSSIRRRLPGRLQDDEVEENTENEREKAGADAGLPAAPAHSAMSVPQFGK